MELGSLIIMITTTELSSQCIINIYSRLIKTDIFKDFSINHISAQMKKSEPYKMDENIYVLTVHADVTDNHMVNITRLTMKDYCFR